VRRSVLTLAACSTLTFGIVPAIAANGSLEVPVKESEAIDAPVTEKLKLYSASKALVIGIDNYTGSGFLAGDRWPKLSKGIEDAVEVAKSLEAKGFTVTLLKDLGSEAMKSAMEDFFIREGADPEARLLIWFAGHGHTIGGEGYLVPADAPVPTKDDVGFRRKALSLRRFGEFMRGANAKHVLAVFDSCFAGTIFDVARSLPPRAITRATNLKVRQFVSAGDADQTVSDNGRFRRIFLDALDGKEPAADPNGDGFITGSELGLFLSDKITNLSEKGQTPRYGKLNAEGYDRGDFVLEKGRLEAPKPADPVPPEPEAASKGAPSTAEDISGAERAWAFVQSSDDIAVLEEYRREFGTRSKFYDSMAASRIAKLKAPVQTAVVVAPPPAPPPIPKPAEPTVGVYPPALKPGQTFRDCYSDDPVQNRICPEMVVVPAGEFTMGSPVDEEGRDKDEGPQRIVKIAKPFAVGKFEVTFAEWDACVLAGGCKHKPETDWGRERQPVMRVSWDDTKEYTAWLSTKTGKTYRLLTEAEWEYVARAGTISPFSTGKTITPDQANFKGTNTYGGSSTGQYRRKTVVVGSFNPNAFGVYDMHGNVGEWVEDCYADSYKTAPSDGSAVTFSDCSSRVLRGGSWYYSPAYHRSANRDWGNPTNRDSGTGFRVARTLAP